MAALSTSLGPIGVSRIPGTPGTPVLLLHGVGSTRQVWQPQLDHFTGRRGAIAIDHPGYGDSAPRPGATHDDFAKAALAVLDALDVERAHICGLSLGGVVAIAVHALAPQRCASLILADTFAVHPDGQAIFDRSVAGSEDMRAFASARAGVLLADPADPMLKERIVATMAAIDPPAYRAAAAAVWLADQRDRVRQIDVPTLILCGEHDRPTPPALSRELHRLIPHAQFELIAGAGHLTNIEQPQAFNRLLDSFLERVDRA
jgi:3-oxoadipate enol-lactonase